jgi:hypothetical protein
MRGETIDFGALAVQNSKQPTLGNTRTNVRGDLLGDNGTVLKTQEQVEAEWAAKRALQEKINQSTNLKADQMGPSAARQPATPAADVNFPTVQDLVNQGAIAPNKRKIVDSD